MNRYIECRHYHARKKDFRGCPVQLGGRKYITECCICCIYQNRIDDGETVKKIARQNYENSRGKQTKIQELKKYVDENYGPDFKVTQKRKLKNNDTVVTCLSTGRTLSAKKYTGMGKGSNKQMLDALEEIKTLNETKKWFGPKRKGMIK